MKLKEKDILKFGTKSEVKFLAEAGWMNPEKNEWADPETSKMIYVGTDSETNPTEEVYVQRDFGNMVWINHLDKEDYYDKREPTYKTPHEYIPIEEYKKTKKNHWAYDKVVKLADQFQAGKPQKIHQTYRSQVPEKYTKNGYYRGLTKVMNDLHAIRSYIEAMPYEYGKKAEKHPEKGYDFVVKTLQGSDFQKLSELIDTVVSDYFTQGA